MIFLKTIKRYVYLSIATNFKLIGDDSSNKFINYEPTQLRETLKNKHKSRAEGSGRLPICQGYVSLHWLG